MSPPVPPCPSEAPDRHRPALSVVIPVRNCAETLAAQLEAIASAAQLATLECEIVVADNGSTDGSADIARSFGERMDVNVVDASRSPGINIARNCGVQAAQGNWIVLCDGDDEVDEQWLKSLEVAFNEGYELLAGPIDYRRLNDPEVRQWRGASSAPILQVLGFLPSGHGANLGFTRRAYDLIGGFDESFVYGSEDTEFCWRAQLAGIALHPVPEAIVHYRLRPALGALWRQWAGYGASEVRLYRTFASAGLQRRPLTAFLRDLLWLITRLPLAAPIGRRGAWLRRLALVYGRFRGAISLRVLWW